MKKIIYTVTLMALSLASCEQFKKGEGDLEYKIHTDVSGNTIKEGDFIALKAIQKTEEDSIIFDSWADNRESYLIQDKSLFKGDLYSGLALMSPGDSATFKINLDSLVTVMGAPRPTNTKGKFLIWVIKVDTVIIKGSLDDQTFNANIQKYITKASELAKTKEPATISAYIASKSLNPQSTASGMQYVITKQASGAKAAPADTVELNYTGSFLNGKVFDTSIEEVGKKAKLNPNRPPYAPLKMPAGVQQSIPGFDEALLLFPVGTKATIILPSRLAYGDAGSQMIPPFTPLIFDIEILRIIPVKK
jgi:FKBP-type peptidyl-prolyl cis-trans isomerase FkpA